MVENSLYNWNGGVGMLSPRAMILKENLIIFNVFLFVYSDEINWNVFFKNCRQTYVTKGAGS